MRALGGGLQFAGRGHGVAWAPRGGVRPPVCYPRPRRLPQEHKAEVKASIKARFQAGRGRGTAGARALTRGTRHGSSEHRRGDAPTSGGETRHTEPGPHPQLAVRLSICPPVHQNSWVPVGWARAPCGRTGRAKLQACSRSLKGKGSGQPGGRALGQGLRPLCPSLGHGDPRGREAVRAGRVTTSGAQERSVPLAASAHGSRTTTTQACSPAAPGEQVRTGGRGRGTGRRGMAFLAEASAPGLGLLSRGREAGRGGRGGSWFPWRSATGGAVGPHTEISYVVPPTPDTFLTSVCRAGLAEGPGGPGAGPKRVRPGDCPLSLLGGVFS